MSKIEKRTYAFQIDAGDLELYQQAASSLGYVGVRVLARAGEFFTNETQGGEEFYKDAYGRVTTKYREPDTYEVVVKEGSVAIAVDERNPDRGEGLSVFSAELSRLKAERETTTS